MTETELQGKINLQREIIDAQRKQIDALRASLLIADAQLTLKDQLLEAYREGGKKNDTSRTASDQG